MVYQPPRHILEVLQRIEFEEGLPPGDPRYVETRSARGSQRTHARLARKFGLLLEEGQLFAPASKHVLFFGHTGCGKTTELRHYAELFTGAERFFVVELDITSELDRNNLQYADALMAMARVMLEQLQKRAGGINGSGLGELENWFKERVLTEEQSKEFAAKISAGAKAKSGIPFLLDLFGQFTAAFKTNATYKDSMRTVVRNTFTQFAAAFNRFLRETEQALTQRGLGKRVLFVIDGTDKMRRDDTRDFFVHNAEQLLAIEALVVYTAPISLKYEGTVGGKLDADLVLPMIRIDERDASPFAEGRRAMREILLRRADRSLFAGEAQIVALVEASGGHPRELLRLLKLCCELTESSVIDEATTNAAIDALAADFRRFLEPEDYEFLARIDADPAHAGNDERTRRLLYNLALLEYNDGSWRRSHPAVPRLEGYVLALGRIRGAPG